MTTSLVPVCKRVVQSGIGGDDPNNDYDFLNRIYIRPLSPLHRRPVSSPRDVNQVRAPGISSLDYADFYDTSARIESLRRGLSECRGYWEDRFIHALNLPRSRVHVSTVRPTFPQRNHYEYESSSLLNYGNRWWSQLDPLTDYYLRRTPY